MSVTEFFAYRFGRKAEPRLAVELVRAYAGKPRS